MRVLLTLLMLLGVLGVAHSVAATEPSCPSQLQEATTYAALISESRTSVEARLAQAIRANKELADLAQRLTDSEKKLKDEIASLKPKSEAPKP